MWGEVEGVKAERLKAVRRKSRMSETVDVVRGGGRMGRGERDGGAGEEEKEEEGGWVGTGKARKREGRFKEGEGTSTEGRSGRRIGGERLSDRGRRQT